MDEELLAAVLHQAWWPALAAAFRVTGDLQFAEDAVQEACAAAVLQWRTSEPADPVAWLATAARRRAIDRLRREVVRPAKEAAAARDSQDPSRGQHPAGADPVRVGPVGTDPSEQLAMMFLCNHPAFDVATRRALTLRAVGGLSTYEIAALLLVPELTVAKRLVRARRKIRDSGMRFAVPDPAALAARLDDVLATLALLYTEGHRSSSGPGLLRPQVSERAVAVARTLAHLLPDEPEVLGLLALLLLTDARRAARVDDDDALVLLGEQDRSRYDHSRIVEGERLLERALRRSRPGRWQFQAAIAACHSTAMSAADTDWREISALYGELLRYDPSPVRRGQPRHRRRRGRGPRRRPHDHRRGAPPPPARPLAQPARRARRPAATHRPTTYSPAPPTSTPSNSTQDQQNDGSSNTRSRAPERP